MKSHPKNEWPNFVNYLGDNLHFNKAKTQRFGEWVNGMVYDSPGYIGYNMGGSVTRLGVRSEFFQNITQDLVHKKGFPGVNIFSKEGFGYQNYYNVNSPSNHGVYFYVGNYNPYSIWGH